MEIKWIELSEANPEREYLALVSYLPLKSFWKIPNFLAYTRAIQNQLRNSEGVVGYSMRLAVLSKKAWTLSAWEDDHHLTEFVRNPPHSKTMMELRPHLGRTKFVKWKIHGAEVPLSWDNAMKKLETD